VAKRSSSTTQSGADGQPKGGQTKWIWEEENAYFGAAGGLARLFQAEQFDNPGVLELDPPANEASLFARETIQNSWDAAREWRKDCNARQKKLPPFQIEFHFIEVPQAQRTTFIDAMGLDEHSLILELEKSRLKGQRPDFDLADYSLLTDILLNKQPLRLLRVVERAGMGMPGNFERNNSRMTRALLRIGQANVEVGAGGAFGFGKAGLIQASAPRVIFAYSAFQEVADDPGITRRFMGVTYWKNYRRGLTSLTGWARFGEQTSLEIKGQNDVTTITSAAPFTNEVADRFASQLGLEVRSPVDDLGTGTSFLLVDPTITAIDLKKAIERYWWPAMLNALEPLNVKICDYDGSDVSPSIPHDDEHLAPFIRAYQLASSKSPSQSDSELTTELGNFRGSDGVQYELGSLAMIADPSGWSFPDKVSGNEAVDHRTMIALMRGPRMVVNYHTFRKLGAPHIRGVFIADGQVDNLLRQTENSTHTVWDSTMKIPGSPAPSIAKAVHEELRTAVTEFQKKFAPPAPKPDDLTLPVLDELSRLMRGRRIRPPKPDPRQVLISITETAHAEAHGDALKCKARVKFRIADWVWTEITESEVQLQVLLAVAYVEDGGLGGKLSITVTSSGRKFAHLGVSSGKEVFQGMLKQAEEVEFTIVSEKYSPDWTVRFTPAAEIINPRVKPRRPRKDQA